ncbi:tape measure domain-containing protein [Aquamicrobium sp. LC103]|uniref:tape measure protein n=1 Tax=Aquamicrobium sp. LC103 TaxID=1120658 RepID=UPI00069A556E|nr:tape measure domain-containing protein [Aquamicrobium sp. LC103]TKT79967.1 tape measure domain-containing protein [Aquamicrobium sp. LC103]
MDIATLGIAVRSDQVDQANRSLERFSQVSGTAERAARNVGSESSKAGRMAAAANDNAASSAARAAAAYGGFERAATLAARAVGAVVGAAAGAALVQFADTWSDISSRVGIAVKDMDAAPAVLARIAQTARMTYSNLELTAEGFVRNATVLNELGKSTQQQLDYQEALNNALVVSGAKGRAAEFVQESLNRSMALGAMRGIELNNVLNYGGRVAELLAKHFNTTTGGLMRLAQEGKITGEVLFNVLTKNMIQLREEAESMPATIGDGMILIRNALLQFVGSMDQALGASETFADGLIIVADNIGRVVSIGAAAVTMYGTYYVASFVAAQVATMSLTGALTLLRAALIRTGIGALVVLLGEFIYQIGEARQHVDTWGEAFQDVFDRSRAILVAFGYGFESIVANLQSIWATFLADMVEGFEASFGGILRAFGVGVEQVSGIISDLRNEAEIASALADATGNLAKYAWDHALRPREGANDGIPNGGGRSVAGAESVDKAAQRAADRYKRIVQSAQQFIAAQQLEAQVIGMTEREANKLRYTQDLLNQAQSAGIKLTASQKAELEGLAASMAETEARTSALQQAFDFAKDVTKGFFNDFRSGLEQGKGVLRSFADAAMNALSRIADKLIDMAINNLWANAFSGGTSSGGGSGVFGSLFNGLGKLFGFSSGGWTGNGATSAVAGAVHGQEFVVRAGPAAQHRQLLEAINAGRPIGANNNVPVASNQNGTSTVRIELADGLKAEIIGEANQNAIQIVRQNNQAMANYKQNGGE